jgi:hypothetical protein
MNTKKEKLGRGLNSRAKEVRREYVEGGIRLAHVLKLAEETSLPDTTPLVFGLEDYWHRSLIPVWRIHRTGSEVVRLYEAPPPEADNQAATMTLADVRRLAAPGQAKLRCAITDDSGLWLDAELTSIYTYEPCAADLPFTATLLVVYTDLSPEDI